jgi:hypothetical protein
MQTGFVYKMALPAVCSVYCMFANAKIIQPAVCHFCHLQGKFTGYDTQPDCGSVFYSFSRDFYSGIRVNG